ncbi:MAG: fibronectin type III domain-containing protein, partial [Bacteroidales bacterium]|nr:fibronectin type III domain-containing protein [Bacteroidales bacterium]
MKRLFIRLSAIMLIASVMLGLSCKGENDVLSVSPSLRNIVFSADGTLSVAGSSDVLQFLVFTVETNRQWQVTANKTWVQALKTEGNVFTLSANPNDSVSPPEDAEVTVTAGNATPVKITVSQLGVDPLVVTPYNMVANIRSDPRTTMAFNWFTDRPATGKVEIVEGKVTEHAAFATPHKTVNATVNDISVRYNSSENRSYNVYKALVEGLTPGTTYSYRVGGYENVWSEIGLFTTAKNDKSDFTFLYTTDPQSTSVANFQLAAKTAQVAYTRFPDMKFWMNCGDLVDQSSGISAWEWEQFFGSQQDIFYKLPFAPVMGNHDAVMPNSFIYYFNTEPTVLAGTSPAKPGSVYSFVYGDVLFLALNFEDYNVSNYLTSIANWMRAEVNKPEHASIRWR